MNLVKKRGARTLKRSKKKGKSSNPFQSLMRNKPLAALSLLTK